MWNSFTPWYSYKVQRLPLYKGKDNNSLNSSTISSSTIWISWFQWIQWQNKKFFGRRSINKAGRETPGIKNGYKWRDATEAFTLCGNLLIPETILLTASEVAGSLNRAQVIFQKNPDLLNSLNVMNLLLYFRRKLLPNHLHGYPLYQEDINPISRTAQCKDVFILVDSKLALSFYCFRNYSSHQSNLSPKNEVCKKLLKSNSALLAILVHSVVK